MQGLRANVDQNACIGCGICIDICPAVFEMDPHGLSESVVAVIDPGLNQTVRTAANACPTQAIRVFG